MITILKRLYKKPGDKGLYFTRATIVSIAIDGKVVLDKGSEEEGAAIIKAHFKVKPPPPDKTMPPKFWRNFGHD